MTRTKELWAALYAAALTMWTFPALALAQATQQRSPPPAGGGTAPAPTPGTDTGGGAGWLWIIAAIVVLAIVWWAMTARRRGTMARTRA